MRIRDSIDLRHSAEEVLKARQSPPPAESDPQKLVHELQLHQIELEIQNLELRQAWQEVEAERLRYCKLFDFAPISYLTLQRGGIIDEINLTAAALLEQARPELLGRRFSALLAEESRPAFAALLEKTFAGTGKATCEAKLHIPGRSPLCVRIDAKAEPGRDTCRAVLIDLTQEKRMIQERTTHRQEIARISRRLINVQETERRELSTELHDRTSANLAAINLNLMALTTKLGSALPADVGPLIADIGALLRDTNTSLREIGSNLRPPALDDLGLVPALESYARKIGARCGIAVRVNDSGEPQVDTEVKSTLFRIAHEALTNCAKHSRATAIELALTQHGERVALSVADNGQGFDVGTVEHAGDGLGQGLLAMRERAEMIGGRFHLESRPGKGTRVSVEI